MQGWNTCTNQKFKVYIRGYNSKTPTKNTQPIHNQQISNPMQNKPPTIARAHTETYKPSIKHVITKSVCIHEMSKVPERSFLAFQMSILWRLFLFWTSFTRKSWMSAYRTCTCTKRANTTDNCSETETIWIHDYLCANSTQNKKDTFQRQRN